MSVNKITMAVVAALFVAPLVVPEAHAINAHYRDQLIKSGCTQITESDGTCDIHKTKAQNEAQRFTKETPGSDAVVDRLHAIKLRGNDYGYFIVSIGNGFTKAMIADEPAKIVRKNQNYYEITNKKYVIGVYLDEQGFSSASWNYHKGRAHGDFVLLDGAE